MQPIAEILPKTNNNQLEPTGSNKLKPTGNQLVGTTKVTKEQYLACDLALSDYQDLMNPQFQKWYCRMFYALGRERFHQIASEARADGKNPKALFSWKLKQATGS